jgi:hypothetical protein
MLYSGGESIRATIIMPNADMAVEATVPQKRFKPAFAETLAISNAFTAKTFLLPVALPCVSGLFHILSLKLDASLVRLG